MEEIYNIGTFVRNTKETGLKSALKRDLDKTFERGYVKREHLDALSRTCKGAASGLVVGGSFFYRWKRTEFSGFEFRRHP